MPVPSVCTVPSMLKQAQPSHRLALLLLPTYFRQLSPWLDSHMVEGNGAILLLIQPIAMRGIDRSNPAGGNYLR